MVDPTVLDRIKQTDSHPLIQAFIVGHEGSPRFKIPGTNDTVVMKWIRRAVEWLTDAIQIGTPAFNRHTVSNDSIGRQQIGEVVGKRIIEHNGIASSVAAFYIRPEARNLDLDVASIEANVEFGTTDGGQVYPLSVQNVTGIALSNHGIDKPGFPGATLLSAVAAFMESEKGNKMNLNEIKQAVQDGGYKPSQLFDTDTIFADSTVVNRVKEEKSNLYSQNQRLEKEKQDLTDKMAALDNKHADEMRKLKAESVSSRAQTVIDKLATDRKLSEKQISYIKNHVDRFSTEATDTDSLETDVNKFLDTELADFKRAQELFGVTEPDDGTGDTDDDDPTDSGTGDDTGNEDTGDKFHPNNPEEDANPLIPGSKADLNYGKGSDN